MWTLVRIKLDRTTTVHLQAEPVVSAYALDGPQLAVRNSEVVGRRSELNLTLI